MSTAAKPIFVAATRQHVGKSTVSLGIVSAMLQKGLKVGFMKPVGQQHVSVDVIDEDTKERSVIQVDKDVRLVNNFFGLKGNYKFMSPVVMPSGYTKQIIDDNDLSMKAKMRETIASAYQKLESQYDFIVCDNRSGNFS